MGALEIRQASATLRPLGSFRMPELDNGSARAWDAQAAAAQKAADAARTAGAAAVSGISRRGQIVADTLKGLGKLAFEFAERENDRIAKEGVLELQRRTNEELYGNGQDKAGRLNENIGDVGAWVKSLKDWNETALQDVEKDMSGAQKRIFREKIANQQLELQTTVAQHAAKTSLKKQATTAEAWSAEKLGVAASSFGNPATRDACVKAYVDAKLDELEVKGVPEEAKPAMMRLAMRDLLSKGWDMAIAGWSAELANNPEVNEDPVAVRKAFEAKAAEAEKVGYMLDQKDIKAVMPDGLEPAEKELFRQRLQEAGVKAADRARALKAENTKAVVEEFDRGEKEMVAKPGDEGYVGTLEAWAKDGRLAKYDPARSKRYQTFARAIREAEESKDREAEDFLKTLPRKEVLQDSLIDAVERVTQARIGGVSGAGVQLLQMDAMQKYQLAMRYGFVDAEFRGKFEKRLKGELKEQTIAALKEWYSRWGVHPATDATGRVTKGEIEGATGEVLVPTAPGAPDGANGSVSKKAFYEATNEFIGMIEASPDKYSRLENVREVARVVERGVFSDVYGGEVAAALNAGAFAKIYVDSMNDRAAAVEYHRMAGEAVANKPPDKRQTPAEIEANRKKLDENRGKYGAQMRKEMQARQEKKDREERESLEAYRSLVLP